MVAEGTATGATRVPDDLDWRGARNDRPSFPDCTDRNVSACTLVRGNRPKLLVVGDSHARMLLPAFEELARRDGSTVSAAVWPVCPWQDALFYSAGVPECRVHKADWYERLVPELDPDIVFVVSHPYDDPANPARLLAGEGGMRTPSFNEAVRTATVETVERLRAEGREVVIVEPIPMAPLDADPVQCLSEAEFLDQCRYVARQEVTPVEQIYRSIADDRAGGVYTLDLDRAVCPYHPICDPLVGGRIVKRDVQHLTGAFSVTLADELQRFLDFTGLRGR